MAFLVCSVLNDCGPKSLSLISFLSSKCKNVSFLIWERRYEYPLLPILQLHQGCVCVCVAAVLSWFNQHKVWWFKTWITDVNIHGRPFSYPSTVYKTEAFYCSHAVLVKPNGLRVWLLAIRQWNHSVKFPPIQPYRAQPSVRLFHIVFLKGNN